MLICLNCTLKECHKGSRSCLVKKAEMQTKDYWRKRYRKQVKSKPRRKIDNAEFIKKGLLACLNKLNHELNTY
jgi:hypothetical protein